MSKSWATKNQALNRAPSVLDSIDMMSIHSAEDVMQQALFEMDIYTSGEDGHCSGHEYRQLQRFVKWAEKKGWVRS